MLDIQILSVFQYMEILTWSPGHNLVRLVLLSKIDLNITIMEDFMNDKVAAIWVKVGEKRQKKMVIGGMYRQHKYIHVDNHDNSGLDSKQLDRWNSFVDSWVKIARGNEVTVVGDMNVDYLRWAHPEPNMARFVDKMKTDIETIGFHQQVTGFTRSWPGQPNSLIDHCWMNSPQKLIHCKNICKGYSDHNLTSISIRSKMIVTDRHDMILRDRKNFDPTTYRQQVELIDWAPLLSSTNIDIINDYLVSQLLNILDTMAPLKVYQKRKQQNNWLSQEVKEKMVARDNLKRTAMLSGDAIDWRTYRAARNACVKALRNCKKDHYQKIYIKMKAENNTKGLYRLTNELADCRLGTTPQSFVIDGKIERKPLAMANAQISHYKEKIVKLANGFTPSSRNPYRYLDKALEDWDHKDARPLFKFQPLSLLETENLLKSLSDSAASGHDLLDARAIKEGGRSLLIPIRHLVNSSLLSEKIASKWKIACLTPRLKSSELDKHSVSSYRPIAILPAISKLVERAAQQQLLNFLENTKQINPANHAYRKHLSTTTTLAKICDEIYKGAEEKKISQIMTIDQSAAFDVVVHEILLGKLSRYNLDQSAINWVSSYLQHRTQYVQIGRFKSNMIAVDRGVPQGSVIGPLLFAIYINEMSEVTTQPTCTQAVHTDRSLLWTNLCSDCGVLTQYADDTTYVVSNPSRDRNQTKIRRNLDELTLFLNDNHLKINQKKTSLTEAMIPQKKGKTPGPPQSHSSCRK